MLFDVHVDMMQISYFVNLANHDCCLAWVLYAILCLMLYQVNLSLPEEQREHTSTSSCLIFQPHDKKPEVLSVVTVFGPMCVRAHAITSMLRVLAKSHLLKTSLHLSCQRCWQTTFSQQRGKYQYPSIQISAIRNWAHITQKPTTEVSFLDKPHQRCARFHGSLSVQQGRSRCRIMACLPCFLAWLLTVRFR